VETKSKYFTYYRMSLDAAQAALEQSQRELSTSREEMLRQGLRSYFTPL
jgi:hypothetical protein